MILSKYLKSFGILLICFVVGLFIQWFQAPEVYSKNETMTVWVFDVGQGDSILITSGSEQVLVDGGPSSSVLEKLEMAMPFWDREIELIVSTHPHADHVTGLNYVLDRYLVDRIWTTGQEYSTGVFKRFQEISNDIIVKSGNKYYFKNGATLSVLWPNKSLEGQYLDDPNSGSIVLLLEYGDSSVLLTGDIGIKEEENILDNLPDIDVLKVAHQGSFTSTSIKFLEIARPEVAIISVGENDYGHPHGIILDRLTAIGANIFRTDQNGDISVILDKKGIKIH